MSPVSQKPRKKKPSPKKVPDPAGELKVNLGGGQSKIDGYLNMDMFPGENVDIVHDLLDFPWPFETSSVDHTRSDHVLEHLPHGPGPIDLFFQFFDELWRVLKPDAQCEFTMPFAHNNRAFQDPTHRRFIVPETFLYLDRGWTKANGLDHYCCQHADFEQVVVAGHFAAPWDRRAEDARQFAMTNYVNVVSDLSAILKCRKS